MSEARLFAFHFDFNTEEGDTIDVMFTVEASDESAPRLNMLLSTTEYGMLIARLADEFAGATIANSFTTPYIDGWFIGGLPSERIPAFTNHFRKFFEDKNYPVANVRRYENETGSTDKYLTDIVPQSDQNIALGVFR